MSKNNKYLNEYTVNQLSECDVIRQYSINKNALYDAEKWLVNSEFSSWEDVRIKNIKFYTRFNNIVNNLILLDDRAINDNIDIPGNKVAAC